MSFETTKQSPSSVRPTSKTGTMLGMVQPGEDAGFVQIRFHILGVSDSFRARHLDRDWAVEVVVVSQIDLSEPALTQASEDRVTPDLRGIADPGSHSNPQRAVAAFRMSQALRLIRGGTRTLNGRLRSFSLGQALRLIHRSVLAIDRSHS